MGGPCRRGSRGENRRASRARGSGRRRARGGSRASSRPDRRRRCSSGWWSFEPVVQRTVGSLSKLTFEATFAAQPGEITRRRSGNDEPCRLDLPLLDDFGTLKDEGTLAFVQFSPESLDADERRGSIGAE